MLPLDPSDIPARWSICRRCGYRHNPARRCPKVRTPGEPIGVVDWFVWLAVSVMIIVGIAHIVANII